MTTYNTGNPLGSTAVKDLYDNAENFDIALNAPAVDNWTDRLGRSRKTWTGMERKFDTFLNASNAEFQQFLLSSGYQDLGDYAAGLNITARNQIFHKDGELYRAGAALDLPYTLTGDWATEGSNFVSVGDAALRQELAAPSGAEMLTYKGPLADEIARPAARIFDDIISVKRWGAVGDYATDDTVAIEKAFAACAQSGKTLYFPSGVYRVTKSLRKPKNVRIVGDGKPSINITVNSDDKRFLRPGYKHLMPGSVIIWSGAQTDTITTTRSDRWAQFGYMLATEYFEPSQIQGVGLICDVDCFTADGELTTPANDNRANYDTGLVVDASMDCKIHQVAVFGYFGFKKGLVIVSRDLGTSNPDYNSFFDTTVFGGAALIGFQGSPNQGLSGTLFSGCNLYDSTYHNRTATPSDDWVNQSALEVDGQVSTTSTISGVKIVGGAIRTTCPVAIQLDRVIDVGLIGVNTECTLNAAYTGQTLQYITGTANTGRVVFNGVRNLGTAWGIRLRSFATEIGGALVVDENHAGIGLVFKGGHGVAYGASDELGGDPVVQLNRADNASVSRGWNLRYVSSGEMVTRFNGSTRFSVSDSGPVVATNGVAGKSGASSPSAPALLPWSGDLTSGFYRGGTDLIGISLSGTAAGTWSPTAHRPGSDNVQSLGLASLRYTTAYLTSNPVVTSDSREKEQIEAIPDAWLDAWGDVQLVRFKWIDRVHAKGDEARFHVGLTSQAFRDALLIHGVDPEVVAAWCYDRWDDQYEDVLETVEEEQEDGAVLTVTRPTGERRLVQVAGDRLGLRETQCLFLSAAYERRERKRLEQVVNELAKRVASLEARP